MAWVWLDDQMPDHPRIASVSPMASWAFVAGLCYCSRMRTDGKIPRNIGRKLAGAKLRVELERAELWFLTESGWQVRDYLDYQPSAAELERKSISGRHRQRRYLERRRVSNGVSDASHNGHESTNVTGTPTPTPTREDQDHGADAPPTRRESAEKPKPETRGVFLKLVASELDSRPELLDEGEVGIREHMKDVAAKAHIPYDGPTLGAALDQVFAARQRKGQRVLR